jgi:hypothetical protein
MFILKTNAMPMMKEVVVRLLISHFARTYTIIHNILKEPFRR